MSLLLHFVKLIVMDFKGLANVRQAHGCAFATGRTPFFTLRVGNTYLLNIPRLQLPAIWASGVNDWNDRSFNPVTSGGPCGCHHYFRQFDVGKLLLLHTNALDSRVHLQLNHDHITLFESIMLLLDFLTLSLQCHHLLPFLGAFFRPHWSCPPPNNQNLERKQRVC